MPTFEYQAQRADGSIERGVVVSGSLGDATQELTAKGVAITQIGLARSIGDPLSGGGAGAVATDAFGSAGRSREAPSGPAVEFRGVPEDVGDRGYFATSVAGPLVGNVPIANLAFFFRQASTMLEAGVPMVQAMNTLAGQARNAKLSSVVKEVARNVEAGRPISAALQRYPEVFSSVMLSMVRAGEEGGFLDKALATVADYIDQEIVLRNLYRKATFWPKIELFFSVIVIIAANAIIDSIKPDAQHLSSPLTTVITWMWLGPLIVGIFLFYRVGLANPRVRYNWDLFISLIPYLGKTLRHIAMARFGRAFGALYRSGVPLQRAVQLAADACGNEYLRAQIYPAYRKLQNGEGLTETLVSTGAFSPIVLDMVRTGETTGSIDQMLNRVSDFYIDDAEVRQGQLGIAIGLLLSLCVGIYIGYIIINFYIGYGKGIQSQESGCLWRTPITTRWV